MSSRERRSSIHQGRSIRTSSSMRHGHVQETVPSDHRQLDRPSHSDLLEHKIASQAAEIDQLSVDNRKLSSGHIVLREELISAEREVQELKSHIRSMTSETDIQIRAALERFIKIEGIVKRGEIIKRELQQAHIDAQNLVKERQELVSKIQVSSEELEKTRVDAKSVPELVSELERLNQKRKRLREKFEQKKGVNVNEAEQLRQMERTLMEMVRKIETLRAEIANAESRTSGNASYPPRSGYPNGTVPGSEANPVWVGPYDPLLVQR